MVVIIIQTEIITSNQIIGHKILVLNRTVKKT